MGRMTDGTREVEWSRRVAEQRGSGLSVAEYCRRQAISPASFFNWRKRLDQAAQQTPLFVPMDLPTAGLESETHQVPPIVGGVRIDLPGGAVVTLPTDAPAELLATAIRAAMVSEIPSC